MTETFLITSKTGEASVSSTGAELRSWRVAGRDVLWSGDPEFWPKTAPVLFPVVGRCAGKAIRVDGVSYPMDVHGFASSSEFTLNSRNDQTVTLTLAATEATRCHYPFAFEFSVSYRIDDASLTATLAVHNGDRRPLPYAVGLHPGFRFPFREHKAGRAQIVFEKAECDRVPVISPDGLFTDRSRPLVMMDNRLPLTDENLGAEALCFLDCNSRRLTFEAPDGSAIVVENSDMPHFAIWTKPSAPLLSIESWTSHGDPQGFAGELADKPSMRLLEPGASAAHTVRYSYRSLTDG